MASLTVKLDLPEESGRVPESPEGTVLVIPGTPAEVKAFGGSLRFGPVFAPSHAKALHTMRTAILAPGEVSARLAAALDLRIEEAGEAEWLLRMACGFINRAIMTSNLERKGNGAMMSQAATVGKSFAEMEAAEAERRAGLAPRSVALTDEEWSAIDTAIPDVLEMVADVRNVFHDLAYQSDLDQPWVNSMMRLASRAIASMEHKELRVLDRLDAAIRHSDRKGAKQ